MSDETPTPTTDAPTPTPEFQEMTTADADAVAPTDPAPAPDAPAEPPAPTPRALARKAERDALKARSRLQKAEEAEARAAAMSAEIATLRELAAKLQSDDPFVRAEAARVDVEALAKHLIESDTPEARVKKVIAEERATEEAMRVEQQRAHARSMQESEEAGFVRDAGGNALIKALLAADDDDGEPVLSRTELLAQGYRVAAKVKSELVAKGERREITNQEILARLESRYRQRLAVQAAPEQAPAKPAAKPVNGAAGARNAGAPRAAPRTTHEIRARLAELMESLQMATIDIAAVQNNLKIVYAEGMEYLGYDARPLFGMIPKVTEFVGKNFTYAVQNANNQGRSANFVKAGVNSGANKYNDFVILRRRNYGRFTIDGEVLASSKGKGAFVDEITATIEGTINTFSDDVAANLYRSGSGSRGVVGSFPTPNTLQLTNPTDAACFDVGMVLQLSATDGGTVVRVGTAAITEIDRENGILTTGGAGWVAQIPGAVAADFIFTDGDYDAKIQGLKDWIPASTAGLATPFNGVVRSVDPVRLAGQRFNGGGAPYEETINNAAGQLVQQGGSKCDHLFMSPVDMQSWVNALTNRIREPRPAATGMAMGSKGPIAEVGYQGIQVTTPMGKIIKVFGDPWCPVGTAYVLTMDSWVLKSTSKVPDFLDFDKAGQILRVADEDAYEGRIGCYANLYCKRPKDNMVITW